MSDSIILHITQSQKWENAKIIDSYHAESLDTEGFIHCSTKEQLIKTANRFFRHGKNLVILYIETEKVTAEICYEGRDNDLFPHIYGDLNINAVCEVIDFESGEDGLFQAIS
jgi:uncharacterized protein (DUF952 family)